MRINSIQVIGLNNSKQDINIKFNDDINIITGKNGSGKTTILKLMWYCISANIERAVREIIFEKVTIKTSKYQLSVKNLLTKNKKMVQISVVSASGEVLIEKKEPLGREHAIELANELTVELFDTSIFFPTFRRIEGGFSMDSGHKQSAERVIRGGREYFIQENYGKSIQGALEEHANRLSVSKHKFVSSISTVDIQHLVTRKHSIATTTVDNYSKSLSEKIFSEIRDYQGSSSSATEALKDAISTLDKINQKVTDFEKKRKVAFNSLNVLSDIIVTIFKHKGIKLNPRVTLGDIDHSINSDSLSAGEKQMLSFLCYNALYSDCPFFIDEPELSLHVDWQRILLDVMVEQKTNNQFFIATHSPFIYTQYEDKEIMISSDRGNNFG
jgi:predicted ATPase